MAGQFPQFDGHLWINSEFGLLDASQGPDTRLMLAVQKKYAPKIAIGAFPQMGFMVGKFSVQALLNVKGPLPDASDVADAARHDGLNAPSARCAGAADCRRRRWRPA